MSAPKPRENSRQYSPAFSPKVKASVLRTMARKSNKHGKEKDCGKLIRVRLSSAALSGGATVWHPHYHFSGAGSI